MLKRKCITITLRANIKTEKTNIAVIDKMCFFNKVDNSMIVDSFIQLLEVAGCEIFLSDIL